MHECKTAYLGISDHMNQSENEWRCFKGIGISEKIYQWLIAEILNRKLTGQKIAFMSLSEYLNICIYIDTFIKGLCRKH